MAAKTSTVLIGNLVEEEIEFSLEELSGVCAVEQRHIVELVDEGLIETRSRTELRFSGDALHRARLALRLQRDLGVNAAGTALVIELLERIESLQRRLGEL